MKTRAFSNYTAAERHGYAAAYPGACNIPVVRFLHLPSTWFNVAVITIECTVQSRARHPVYTHIDNVARIAHKRREAAGLWDALVVNVRHSSRVFPIADVLEAFVVCNNIYIYRYIWYTGCIYIYIVK